MKNILVQIRLFTEKTLAYVLENPVIVSSGAVIVVFIIGTTLFVVQSYYPIHHTSRYDKVTQGTLVEAITATGTISAAHTFSLSFQTAGKITAINVKAGSTVQAGEVLATLDDSALQTKLKTAQATLASDQLKLQKESTLLASTTQASSISSGPSASEIVSLDQVQNAVRTAVQNAEI